jgi:hypothetical protein
MSFGAPWSTRLKATSAGALTAFAIAFVKMSRTPDAAIVDFLLPVLVALLVGSALTTVRGYEVTPDAIVVKRLLWTTRIPRAGLVGARPVVVPWHAWRLLGNGGLFSFSGWFKSAELGFFHGMFTNSSGVLLDYGNRRFVLSPDDPGRFTAALAQ